MEMKLHIKNMVSLRCILWVKAEMDRLGIVYSNVRLGEADLPAALANPLRDQLDEALRKVGLEIIEDRKKVLVEKIKNTIVAMIHHRDELPSENYSIYISRQIGQGYTQLANIFSESEGITIEHFIIAHKVEKVKELLVYGELTLSQIADKLHYSSVAHLSNQFKKVAGVTPSQFKTFHTGERHTIESIP